MIRFTLAAGSVLLALGSPPAQAAVDTTVAATSQIGRDRFIANSLSLNVAPSKEVALDVDAGRSRSASIISDSSFGGGVWVQAMPRLALSLHGDRFNGEKGFTDDLRTGEFLDDNAKAQETNTFTLGTTVRVWGSDEPADDENADDVDPPVLGAVRVSLGGSLGTLHIPVTTIGPLGRPRNADFTQKQSSASAGLSAVVMETEFGYSFRRNRYGEVAPPPGTASLARPRLAAITERIRTSVGQVLSEPVAYVSEGTISEKLPHGLAVYGSFDYAVLEYSRGVARTTTGELTWDVARWLGIKAGGIWVHEKKTTTPYVVVGLNVYL